MTLVCIDGVDGSGKSVFGDRLAAQLAARGVRAPVVRVDDFRRQVAFDGPQEEHAVYYERYYDFDRIEACLEAFRGGADGIDLDLFDPALGRPARRQRLRLAGAGALILEGVFTLRVPSARTGYLVWLETSPDEARRRIVGRDTRRGRARDEIERRIDRRYVPSQRRYLREHDPLARADLVIDNEDVGAPRARRGELARLPDPLGEAIAALVR